MHCHSPSRHPELASPLVAGVPGSISPVTLLQRRQTQAYRQINPLRIFRIDQVCLRRPMPVFQLLLARYRRFHLTKYLKMHKAINGIFRCMPRHQAVAMLRQALRQIGRHADIKRTVKFTCKDIDARVSFFSHWRSLAEKWTLKQVQGDELFESGVHPLRHPKLVSGSTGRFTQFVRLLPIGTAP